MLLRGAQRIAATDELERGGNAMGQSPMTDALPDEAPRAQPPDTTRNVSEIFTVNPSSSALNGVGGLSLFIIYYNRLGLSNRVMREQFW